MLSNNYTSQDFNFSGMMIDNRTALKLYECMLRIRHTEETIAGRYSESKMRCPTHLSTGQEAVGAGVCSALRKDDFVLSTHRCHAHYLAKGGDLNKMIAEIYGKATGCTSGKGGSMHLIDKEVGILGTVPIVAATIPMATGTAMASKLREIRFIRNELFHFKRKISLEEHEKLSDHRNWLLIKISQANPVSSTAIEGATHE